MTAALALERPLATSNLACLEVNCWCERTTVEVPVQWVSEARTGSCGPDCGPGCPTYTQDAFEDPGTTNTQRKATKMKRFDPETYTPRADSSFGYAHGETRRTYPDDLILQVRDRDLALCACGCTDIPNGKKARFGMGHDVRLKGKLARAHAADRKLVLTDADHGVLEVLSPLDYADRFSTDKLDWRAATIESAARAAAKAVGGPQVGSEIQIRIGRWPKTAKVVRVRENGALEVEYTNANGNTRLATNNLGDGVFREMMKENS